ncbi:MAG: CsbD family protein, partial [Rhodospirillaceae bacterium]
LRQVHAFLEGIMFMNKNRVAGSAKTQAGKVQAAAGKAVNSPKLQAKGLAKEAEGRVQNAAGKANDAVKRAAKH